MKKLNDFIKWFLYITTWVLVVCTANFTIAGADMINTKVLWQILLSSFVTSLITMLFYPREEKKKKVMYIQYFTHYAVLCIAMIICGIWFDWINLDLGGIIAMAISVAVVYLLSFASHYIIDMKQADEINKRLKEKYGDK